MRKLSSLLNTNSVRIICVQIFIRLSIKNPIGRSEVIDDTHSYEAVSHVSLWCTNFLHNDHLEEFLAVDRRLNFERK